jgi:hypothetical protein
MDDTPPEDKPRRPWEKNKPARRDDRSDDTPREGRRRDDEDEEDWHEDDRPRRRRRPEPETDPALKFVVPLNTSALAIIAGYLGLISVLCLPAPFALLFGILALRHLQRNPKLDGKGRAIFAIVMGTLFTGVLAISLIGLAASGVK